jgi:hypothetical protein
MATNALADYLNEVKTFFLLSEGEEHVLTKFILVWTAAMILKRRGSPYTSEDVCWFLPDGNSWSEYDIEQRLRDLKQITPQQLTKDDHKPYSRDTLLLILAKLAPCCPQARAIFFAFYGLNHVNKAPLNVNQISQHFNVPPETIIPTINQIWEIIGDTTASALPDEAYTALIPDSPVLSFSDAETEATDTTNPHQGEKNMKHNRLLVESLPIPSLGDLVVKTIQNQLVEIWRKLNGKYSLVPWPKFLELAKAVLSNGFEKPKRGRRAAKSESTAIPSLMQIVRDSLRDCLDQVTAKLNDGAQLINPADLIEPALVAASKVTLKSGDTGRAKRKVRKQKAGPQGKPKLRAKKIKKTKKGKSKDVVAIWVGFTKDENKGIAMVADVLTRQCDVRRAKPAVYRWALDNMMSEHPKLASGEGLAWFKGQAGALTSAPLAKTASNFDRTQQKWLTKQLGELEQERVNAKPITAIRIAVNALLAKFGEDEEKVVTYFKEYTHNKKK